MESSFAQENPLSLGVYRESNGSPSIFVDTYSNPLWAELLSLPYLEKISTGTPVTPIKPVILPTLDVLTAFGENHSLREDYDAFLQDFKSNFGYAVNDRSSTRYTFEISLDAYLAAHGYVPDVIYLNFDFGNESKLFVSIEEIRTVYPNYASHVANLPVASSDGKQYMVPDGRTINQTAWGYYISKSAWEDPELRDAAVQFVQDLTSSELSVLPS